MMQDFLSKFKLDKHHTIERFAVTFFSLTFCMLILLGSIIGHKVRVDANVLGTQAVYTETFQSSTTSTNGEVLGAWRSEDMKDFFLLLKFDDTAKVSTNAEDYQLFLTGTSVNGSDKELISTPGGIIYSFGSTGYLGVHLHNELGFQKQLVKMTVRCNNNLSVPETNISAQELDESFGVHDQFQLVFNPGGTDAIVADFFNKESINIFDVYETVVARPKEEEIKVKLNETLEEMSVSLNKIDEYERRIIEDGLQLPQRPQQIRGDKVVAVKDGKELTRDRDMWKDEEGKQVESGNYDLTLKSDYVIRKGFNFNWHSSSVASGYWKQFYDKPNKLAYYKEHTSVSQSDVMSVSDIQFFYKDGSSFETMSTSLVGTEQMINSDIQNLLTAWQEYYNLKTEYETKELPELLLLELEAEDVSTKWTRNDKEKAFICY